MEKLVRGDLHMAAGKDLLEGLDGADAFTGDNRLELVGVWGLPDSPGEGFTRLDITVEKLVDDVRLGGERDTLIGGEGDDAGEWKVPEVIVPGWGR